MSFLASLKNLFSGSSGGDTVATKAQSHVYKGHNIDTHPIKAEGGYRVAGTIRKQDLEHPFIRADLAYSLDQAHVLTLNKAKQAIDQLGERLFS